jgi:hypothetical protein
MVTAINREPNPSGSNHKHLDQPGTKSQTGIVISLRDNSAVFFIQISLVVMYLAVQVASAVLPYDNRQTWPLVTSPELNVTGTIENHSLPSQYEITPTLIHIGVKVSETSFPALKGEMAAGPRTIGFEADPFSLIFLAVATIAIAAGFWYAVTRKPEENDGKDKEE